MNIKRLTTLSMLIALNVVLCTLTPINLISFKLTFEAYPILVAGLLLGPMDGLIVGSAGSLLYQVLFSGYGFTATTLLWVLPHALSGLIVGLLGKTIKERLTFSKAVLISIISSLIVTSFNLLALYVDSKLNYYYSDALILGGLVQKIIVGVGLSILYSLTLPKLIETLKKLK